MELWPVGIPRQPGSVVGPVPGAGVPPVALLAGVGDGQPGRHAVHGGVDGAGDRLYHHVCHHRQQPGQGNGYWWKLARFKLYLFVKTGCNDSKTYLILDIEDSGKLKSYIAEYLITFKLLKKLDRVGPVDNRPSTD